MYSGEDKKREINPKEEAGIFSKLFFIFVYKTLRKGVTKDLEVDDVYEIMKNYSSKELGDKLETLWNKEAKQPEPNLLKPLFKIFGIEYALIFLYLLIYESILMTVESLLIGKVVSYFESDKSDISRNEALTHLISLLVCKVVILLFDHHYFFFMHQLCLRIRIACSTLIYRKSINLNLSSSGEYSNGQLVTLITKDILMFDLAMELAVSLLAGSLEFFVIVYIMYLQVGFAVFIGMSYLFLLIPFYCELILKNHGNNMVVKLANQFGFHIFHVIIVVGNLCLPMFFI